MSEIVPTPIHMQTAFEMVLDATPELKGREGLDARKSVFINAQWAFGGKGTGAPV